MLFNIDVVIPLRPVGIIVHDAYFRYIPASILSNKNWHIGSANDISGGRHIKEQHIVNSSDELICFFSAHELPDCIIVAISGMSAIDSEPIKVEGIVSIGKAMPIAIPSILRDCDFVYPIDINLIGSIMDIKGLIRLPHNLVVVSGNVLQIIDL